MENASSYSFRRLQMRELEAAYAIVTEVTAWLLSKGIRQWAQALPRNLLAAWRRGAKIMDCSSMGSWQQSSRCWRTARTYFVIIAQIKLSVAGNAHLARQLSGQKLGELAMLEAEHFLAQEGISHIYLDYKASSTLPRFYHCCDGCHEGFSLRVGNVRQCIDAQTAQPS